MTSISIEQEITRRGITEVLHFTTNNGLLGIVVSGKLLAHSELPKESLLSHIIQVNCQDRRRDTDWHSYVNLSISKINESFFGISRGWHSTKNLFWCILSFSSEIIAHDNVYFSTTNNAYPLTERGTGLDGFKALFKPEVRNFQTKVVKRKSDLNMCYTTCPQAELLYPNSLSLEYLNCIYLKSEDDLFEVEAQISVCRPEYLGKIKLVVSPDLFN